MDILWACTLIPALDLSLSNGDEVMFPKTPDYKK